MKIDPYNHEEKYRRWKESLNEKIPELSDKDSKIILEYLEDMENGLNVANSSKKGSRSYIRLATLKSRLMFLSQKFKQLYGVGSILEINERQLHSFFSGLRRGEIKKQNGQPYKAVVDYVKIFKAFWHWHQKVSKKEGITILDITADLDTSKHKPEWVYLTEEEVKKLADNANYKYKNLIMFLFDTGIRAPTELVNIKVSDFYNDFKELQIRDEVSKTFGRKIKLMICSKMIKEYIESNELGPDDYVFNIDPSSTNLTLKRMAKRIFGEGKTPAGQKYSELTMYDFRHCSCCYWLPRYKSESALKFSWFGKFRERNF